MEDKPKKKWVSSRLKSKKQELGIDDKEDNSKKNSKKSSKKNSKKIKKPGKKYDTSENKFKKGSKRGSKRGSNGSRNGSKTGSRNRNRNRQKHVIKISNLPSDISVPELAELISPWGEIGNINIKNYSEAYCSYVDFYNKNEADYFIKALDQTPFDNMIIRTELMNFS
jgi:hypothetical protein